MVTYQCDNCGEILIREYQSRQENAHHFCNGKCQKEYIHNQRYESRKCDCCGEAFSVSKKNTQRFCSTSCQNEWQKLNKGSKNPKYKREVIKCDWCNATIMEYPCKIKNFKYHFCNESCRRAWHKNIFSQDEIWKEKSQERAVRILSEGLVPVVNTSAQKKVNQLLDELSIKYVNEFNCKYFSVDNYLTSEKLMIEVMGDFWHTNPLKYDTPLYKRQTDRVGRDKAKRKYIKNKYGIDILYLWEDDINKNPMLCRMLIEEYIKNKGVLLNYNSFNYCVFNNKIQLKENIILAFYERQVS